MDFSIESEEFYRLLLQQGLLQRQKDGPLIPTGFGLLLFGTDPRSSFPQAGLMAKAAMPDGRTVSQSFEGPLVLIPNQLESWLERVIPVAIDRSQMVRKGDTLFPLELLREGVINALVHRDYEIEEAKVQLEIHDDYIVIHSPGRPVEPLTLEQMQEFAAPSLSRNPILHFVFNRMKMAEERGFGMKTWRSVSADYDLQPPTYDFEPPNLVLTFSRESVASVLTEAEQLAYDWMQRQTEGFTTKEYIAARGGKERSVTRLIARLKELGLVSSTRVGNSYLHETVRRKSR